MDENQENITTETEKKPEMVTIEKEREFQGIKMLKIVAILMILKEASSLVGNILTSKMSTDALKDMTSSVVAPNKAALFSQLGVINSFLIGILILGIICGVVGILFYKKPDKSYIVMILGAVDVVLYIIYIILGAKVNAGLREILSQTEAMQGMKVASNSMVAASLIMSTFINLILPVLYIVGGSKLQKHNNN